MHEHGDASEVGVVAGERLMVICREEAAPVALFFALMAAGEDRLEQGESLLAERFSPVILRDDTYDFDALSDYYRGEFGAGLRKRIVAMRDLIAPETLADIKRQTNGIEAELALRAQLGRREAPRVLNVDPGYLALAKIVLASTKDHAHRIYVGGGIYEEVTLLYHRKVSGYEPLPWTYPDYRMPERLAFFGRLRETYRRRLGEQR